MTLLLSCTNELKIHAVRWDLEKKASVYKEREMKFNKKINMIMCFCFCFVFNPQEPAPHEAECSSSCF